MKRLHVVLSIISVLAFVAIIQPVQGQEQEPLYQRWNFFGMHNLKDGGPPLDEGMEWTKHLVGGGFVFDWVFDFEPWIEKAFELGLIPCIRVQECNGGCIPSPGYAGNVAWAILNYKIAHPEYADRLVYLQLWNEPHDPRDKVEPDVYADYLVAAHNAVHQAEREAAAAHPGLGLEGTLKTMTPGQNGPSWWDEAFSHNPDAKFAFDVWGTHPYPEATPPHYNLHDGDVFIETSKTIDSYLMDLDVVAMPHGNPPRSRRGFPVMITETAYGEKLGISYEGWPKTNRQMAANYNVDAFGNRWYRWPEIIAVHPFILANMMWEAFAWVHRYSDSKDTNGDGIREPTDPYPQYSAVRKLRLDLEEQGMAPARLTTSRGPKGKIKGTIIRSDTGDPVPYATMYTDGYEFGHVSLYDGKYEIHEVPAGTYTLTAEKNGYVSVSKEITVNNSQTTTVDFGLVYRGNVSEGLYFVDSFAGHSGCSGCDLFADFLGQTFKTPPDVGYIKYVAAKPNLDDVTLKFSILEGGPWGPQMGPSITATLEPGDGAIMIGAEWPDGEEPVVQPSTTYFLKVERADGQGIYCYASDSNPYPDGNAYVAGTSQPGWDLYAVIRGLTVEEIIVAGTIAGTVTDPFGTPLSSATVATAPGGCSAVTDDNGDYRIENVPVGTHNVSASRAGFSSETAGGVVVEESETTIVDFTLEETLTGAITGTVKDPFDSPILGALIETTTGGYAATTNSYGNYMLNEVLPGTYTLRATRAGYVETVQPDVSVTSGETTTVHFRLTPIVQETPTVNNTDFEGDGGFFMVASGWSSYGGNKWEGVWDPDRSFTQGVSDIPPSDVGGVYQTVAVIPGTTYRVAVLGKTTNPDYEVAIGVDPEGGTDPDEATVSSGSTSASWTQLTVDFTATGPVATIFLQGRNTRSWYVFGWVQFDEVTIEVVGTGNTPPTAMVSAAPMSGEPPLVVDFDGTASFDPDGDPLSYAWDFGDGQQGAGVRVSHTYQTAGTFTAVLTVADGNGGTDTDKVLIVVRELPGQGESKLSIHTSFLGPESMWFIEPAQPTVVKILDELKVAQEVKEKSPNTLIVGRIWYDPWQKLGQGNPEDRALEWWGNVRQRILAYPAVDYWEGYNEPAIHDPSLMEWYARFEKKRVEILVAHDRKACIGNFSTGMPPVEREVWEAFYPAIDAAIKNGGVLGLHEYSARDMDWLFDHGIGEGWLTGRYRKVYRQFLIPDGLEIPLIITECGIDGGVLGDPREISKGWRSYQTPEDYFEQLKWYDSLLKEDSYVLGATIFCLEIPNWGDFDIGGPVREMLTDYVRSSGSL